MWLRGMYSLPLILIETPDSQETSWGQFTACKSSRCHLDFGKSQTFPSWNSSCSAGTLCCSRANWSSAHGGSWMAWSYGQTQPKTIHAIPHHKYTCSAHFFSPGRCCANHWLHRQQETQHILPDLHICALIVGSSSPILQSLFHLNSWESPTVGLRLLHLLIKDSPARGPLLPVAIIAIKGGKRLWDESRRRRTNVFITWLVMETQCDFQLAVQRYDRTQDTLIMYFMDMLQRCVSISK